MASAKKMLQGEVATDELGHFRHPFSITMELEKHPLMAAMAIIAVVLIIIYVFKNLRGNSSGSSGTVPPTQPTQPFYTQVSPPSPTPPGPVPPPPPPPVPQPQSYPYPGKSPFAFAPGQPLFNWTGPDGVAWTVGFGPPGSGRVWGVRGFSVPDAIWKATPAPPKVLIYQ